MKEIEDAADALQRHEDAEQRRRNQSAKRFPPVSTVGYTSVWAPTLIEQQSKEREQYIKDNDLPF
jgi:50S ribosomal subunit-associated GTPase HflX